MSQPALTLNIRQFEEIVGVELLHRTTRSVSLTPCGRDFLPIAEKLLNEFDAAILELRARAQQQENRVDVAVLPSVAIRVLPAVVRRLGEIEPEVKIHVHDDNGRGVQTQVLNGDADCGISNVWEQHPDLEFTPLIRDRVGLICRSEHPLAKEKGPLRWSCLEGCAFVGMTDDTGISRLMRAAEDLPEAVISPTHNVLTIAALVGLVERGDAVSALPALASPDYLNPALVYRDLSAPVMYRELCLITLRDRPLTKAAETFRASIQSDVAALCAMFPNDTVEPGRAIA